MEPLAQWGGGLIGQKKSSFINGIDCILTLMSQNFHITKVGRVNGRHNAGDTMLKHSLAIGFRGVSTVNSFIDQS